jgi:hypothetical protein
LLAFDIAERGTLFIYPCRANAELYSLRAQPAAQTHGKKNTRDQDPAEDGRGFRNDPQDKEIGYADLLEMSW